MFAEPRARGGAIRRFVARRSLGLPGADGRGLCSCPACLAGQEGFDLLAPAAERAQHAGGPLLEFAETVGRVGPGPAEARRDLVMEHRLVGGAGCSLPFAQDGLHVERAPPVRVVLAALGHVGDDDVGVQLRVGHRVFADRSCPGVLDHDRQQPVRLVPLSALCADAHAHRLVLEQPQRGFHGGAVRGQQLAAGLGVAEGECQADALRCAEGEVPAAHALMGDLALDDLAACRVVPAARHERAICRASQELGRQRVAALDQAHDRARRCVALEAEQLGAAAPPDTGPLAPLGVVVVQALPERLLVVGGARQVHRRDAQHDARPPAGMPRRPPFPAAPRLRSCLTRRASRSRSDARRTRGPSRRPVMSAGYPFAPVGAKVWESTRESQGRHCQDSTRRGRIPSTQGQRRSRDPQTPVAVLRCRGRRRWRKNRKS